MTAPGINISLSRLFFFKMRLRKVPISRAKGMFISERSHLIYNVMVFMYIGSHLIHLIAFEAANTMKILIIQEQI